MKRIEKMFFVLGCSLLMFACSSEPENVPVDDSAVERESEAVEEVEEISAEPSTFLFKSDDLGTGEFLKLVEGSNGERTWYYYSEKRPEEVKLGRKIEKGFENIYFTSSPKVMYTIGGSECGFHLSDNVKESSQWYEQIEPVCTF